MYIDRRPKVAGNIAGFINSTRPTTTNKQLNFIFEGREGNHVFVCALKPIVVGKELLIDYNLNWIDTDIVIMGAIHILFYPTYKQWLLYFMIIICCNMLSCILLVNETFE